MLFWFCSCNSTAEHTTKGEDPSLKTEAEKEVLEMEKAFNDMAASEGVAAAFLHFAADDAVLMRRNRIIDGKAAIGDFFEGSTLDSVQLVWKPDFVRASKSGDMAYTYGPYTFSARDTAGQLVESSGIFHTVWFRQADGTWRFVYD